MDKFGVPKKVNRHVIKAVNRLASEGCDRTNFTNICDAVEDTLKNTVPTPNFHNSVRLSLQNFCKLGVFEKKAKGYYKPVDVRKALEAIPRSSAVKVKPKVFTKTEKKERNSNLNPNRTKRRCGSDDSIPENDPSKPIKRQRVEKSLNRKGHRAHLPKARVHRKDHEEQVFDQPDGKQPSEIEEINIPFSSRSEPRLNFTGFGAMISFETDLEDINIAEAIQMRVDSRTLLTSDIPDPQQESAGCSVLFQSNNSFASSVVCEHAIQNQKESPKESQKEPESSGSQNEEEKSKVVVKTEHNSDKPTNPNPAPEHDSSSENKS